RESAEYFGFAFDEADVRAVLEDAGTGTDRPVRVRLRLTRTGKTEIGVAPIDPGDQGPVPVAVDDRPVDPTDVFLFHKTSLRTRYDEARARNPAATDVLLSNDRGEVPESTIANVAVKMRGRGST